MLEWECMGSKTSSQAKIAVAKYAAANIPSGILVGVGSGSTVKCFLEELAKVHRKGLQVVVATASLASERVAKALGIPSLPASEITLVDLLIDGADAVDPLGNMIKGGGGALLREKILAYSTTNYQILIDDTKLTDELHRLPLPIEISPFAYPSTLLRLQKQGFSPTLRKNEKQQFFVSDNGNYIADLLPGRPPRTPKDEDLCLKQIPGVLETGLFLALTKKILIGSLSGEVREL